MIKPLNTIQLSAAKPRSGLQSIGDLLPRLIRQYEMQAELARKEEGRRENQIAQLDNSQNSVATQVTFSWYE